jgi:thiamine-phosphate pyrophosphorylase
MKLALLSPPYDRVDEIAIVQALVDVGLDRYHLRKPNWSEVQVASWLEGLPDCVKGIVYLHSHHGLAAHFPVAGIHFRDERTIPEESVALVPRGCKTSRSCHDLAALEAVLGSYDSVLFGPVFPSLSKPGYGPLRKSALDSLKAALGRRDPAARRTEVFAIGGVMTRRLPICQDLGFDGMAVLGAVWTASDPVMAFVECLGATRRLDRINRSPMENKQCIVR